MDETRMRRREFTTAVLMPPLLAGCIHLDDSSDETDERQEDAGSDRVHPGDDPTVVDETYHEPTPYGDELDPRQLTISAYETGEATVTVHEEGEAIYEVTLAFHAEDESTPSVYHDGIEVGRSGNYTIRVESDEGVEEATWRVEKGYSSFAVDPLEPEFQQHEETVNLEITEVEEHPPDVDPVAVEEVDDPGLLERLLAAYSSCREDGSRDGCLHPHEVRPGLEEGEVPLTGTATASGKEYAEARRLERTLPYHPPSDEHLRGHYIQDDGTVYAVLIGSSRGGVRE